MTKRKAIEAALRKYDDDGSAEALADRTYETGRIAGLREAVKVAIPPHCDSGEYVWDGMARIRIYANMLAKKARAK